MAIVPKRTINDMTSPDLNQQPLYIEYPDLEVNFELKSSLVHLLLTFRGLAETPTEHADAVEDFPNSSKGYMTPSPTPTTPDEGSPELSYGTQSQNFQRSQYRPPMQPPSNPKQGTHLEYMMKSLISNTQQIQQNTQQQIQQLRQNTEHQFQQFQQSVQQFQLSTQTNENSTKRGHAQKRKPEKEVEIPPDQDDEAKKDDPKVLVTDLPSLKGLPNPRRRKKRRRSLKSSPSKGKLKGNELSLHVGPLKETGVVIQLADQSVVYSDGVLEDVLVKVNELVFPTDFYVLDMREDNFPNSTSILLGRPFLKTARTKIDVHAGTLTMEFDDEIIRFNIFDSMRYPSDIPTALFLDAFDFFVQKFPAIDNKDCIKFALKKSPTPMEEGNMGVDPLMQVNAKFDGDSVFLAKFNKDLTYGPRTYKNKAFHDKISSGRILL
ncbi:hypothetical protein Sango_2957300 [Sesamum angolense]|uniref:Reverse transcriptase domain-containing protein n=1 Tax=Sesamum angolense TaxID=2727404 RepID=A0AAE1T4S6_9LAMI|nr:hypothetical protein Sango_2957300 [Sesamum angolense]